MAEYHVGCGIAGIYAGTLNKKGDMWVNKSDVTDEAYKNRLHISEEDYKNRVIGVDLNHAEE